VRCPPSSVIVTSGCSSGYHRRFRSTDEASSTHDNDNEAKEETPKGPVVVFPWRHEEQPLPRWIQGTDEYNRQGHLLYSVNNDTGDSQLNMIVTAYMFLEIPLYQVLLFGRWKEDLTDNMSWAFTRGVAGLLSSLTRTTSTASPNMISMNDIVNDTYEVSFHATIGGNKRTETPNEDIQTVRDPEGSVPLEQMFQEKVIDLYSAAKGSIAKETEVCLKTYPHTTELVSLYAMPYISRDNIKNDKALLSFYRELMSMSAIDRPTKLTKLRNEKLEAGIMESTVIAQVLVWCNEIFFVKDVESGKILQGSDQHETARNVCHLLRMESTVKTTKDPHGSFKNIQGDWIITDIDDLLGGNLIV
jgi:hypothetical protein